MGLLLLGAVMHDHPGDDEVRVDDSGDAHPATGDLFDYEGVGEQRLPQAAVLLGNHQSEDAELLQALDDVGRVLVLVLQVRRVGQDLVVDVLSDCLEDLDLDVRESFGLRQSRHRPSPSASRGSG